MPVNILVIESESFDRYSIEKLLNDHTGIKYQILSNFNTLKIELLSNTYSHMIAPFTVDDELIVNYLKFINIPLLIVTELNITNFSLCCVKPPLSYETLFKFICEKLIISSETLNNFGNGDEVFLNKIKTSIISEFEMNLIDLPGYIKSNNLEAIQRNVHKLVGKFGMLNMTSTYDLAIQIDKNIINEPEIQLDHLNQLLIDIEIAFLQLKTQP